MHSLCDSILRTARVQFFDTKSADSFAQNYVDSSNHPYDLHNVFDIFEIYFYV